MLDDQQWAGDGGEKVRKFTYLVRQAEEAVEAAKRELHAAHAVLEGAERDLNTAKEVYHACRKDQAADQYAQRVTPEKQRWLKMLAKYPIFGSAEMRHAATAIGWNPSDVALRVLASDYRKSGYFIGVSHGVMKLNGDRIEKMVGPIFTSEPEADGQLDVQANISGAEDQVLDATDGSVGDVEAEAPDRHKKLEDDGYDDDLPF